MKDCSQCGKSVEKYHRIFKGEGYCTTCYVREFKPKPCAKCGEVHRLPRKIENAVCDKCRTDKPCIRCGKQKYRIGKLTQYGPVCNACAHYFREKKACDSCGTLTTRLSRLDKSGRGKQLCTRCYTAAKGYQTCPKCKKYRLLVETEHDMMCKKCANQGEILCQECSKYIPAGLGNKCHNCIWKNKLNKRIELLGAGIKSKTAIRHGFCLFGKWLATDVGYGKAAMTIERYAGFFQEVAIHWDVLPTYDILLQHFKPKGMRKMLKVRQWLETLSEAKTSQKLTNDLSEQDRIRTLLAKIEAKPVAKSLLAAYYAKLLNKIDTGKTTIKSVRLALQPAVGLMTNLIKLPRQTDVDGYLKQKSGQRAALLGFINFINQEYNLDLKIDKLTVSDKQKIKEKRKQELEKRVIDYVVRCRKNPNAFNLNEWVRLALPYFHGINASNFEIERINNGVYIKICKCSKLLFLPICK